MIVNNSPALSITDDVLLGAITPKLSIRECIVMKKVCKEWDSLLNMGEIVYDRIVFFGEKKWRQIPGVESVSTYTVDPELKKDYIERLKAQCDIFFERDATCGHSFQSRRCCSLGFWETHRAILIPEMINGKPVNIDLIGQIFGFANANGTSTFGRFYQKNETNETNEYCQRLAGKTKILEVTLDMIPNCKANTYLEKEEFLNSKGYRVPTPLEAVISILVSNLGKKEKEFFFKGGYKYPKFTATNELYGKERLIVGEASSAKGVWISDHLNEKNRHLGVMGVQEVLVNKTL